MITLPTLFVLPEPWHLAAGCSPQIGTQPGEHQRSLMGLVAAVLLRGLVVALPYLNTLWLSLTEKLGQLHKTQLSTDCCYTEA